MNAKMGADGEEWDTSDSSFGCPKKMRTINSSRL
jgi:hypothetical protein